MATAIILLIYGGYSLMNYKYLETEKDITDSIIMYYPSTSEYKIVGDTVEFRNSAYDFYNMDVSKLNSTDKRVTNLLNSFANVNQGTIDYKNESCYLLTMEFDDNGFKYHSIIIPVKSFDKDKLTFKNKTNVYLYDGNNREFVIDSAFNSQVVL